MSLYTSKIFARMYRKDEDGEAAEGAAAVGGPGEEENAPELQEVNVGGKKFKVDSGVAVALNGFMEGVRAEMAEFKRTATPAPAPVKKEAEYDFATGLFTEPEVAIAKLRESIAAEIRAEYTQTESMKTFWASFYDTNKDLKGLETLVDAVMTKHYDRLKDKPALDAMVEIAKLTKEEAVKMGVTLKAPKSGKKDDEDDNDRSQIEGTSTGAKKSGTQKQENVVTSLSDVVRQRQAAKRKAAN